MNPEDELLRALAEIARDDERAATERLDHRFDRLCAGELSAAEIDALRAAAARSEETRHAFEAFRPLGDDFHAKLVERLRGELSVSRTPVAAEPQGIAAAESRGVVVRPRRWRRGAVARWAVPAAIAAAAVLALVVGRPADHPPSPLPEYRLVLSGDTRLERSPAEPSSETRRLSRGNRFELVLRPEVATSEAVDARLFLARDEELRRWPIPAGVLEIDPELGTVRIAGRVGEDILLPAGSWTLIAAVGRPEDLPTAAEVRAARTGGDTPRPGWRLLETAIEVE